MTTAISTDIKQHTEAGVLTLTFNRLEKKNSVTAEMYGVLADALQAAQADAGVRAVVIQGHELMFSAGNDLSDFLNNPPTGDDAPVFRFLGAISTFPKPVIAAVCGPAVGIGTTLLLHCDLVYAGDNALFSMPFVNLGLVPEAASSLLFPQLVGPQRAAQALLLGEPFDASAALEMGLVNKVLPPTEVSAYAAAQAAKLAAKPASSVVATKRLLRGWTGEAGTGGTEGNGGNAEVQARMALEGASFSRMLREPAAKEAFNAFLEKRKPDFSRI